MIVSLRTMLSKEEFSEDLLTTSFIMIMMFINPHCGLN